ncbi:alpha-ketoglutarate-dependent dioxygenase AlkB [Flavobacterium sp. UMI-01]|uniref:alpha-ketoglutarate-dependent dioxygenase AlkB family protein n=1 Tax=Flavobacterium sp. UMI-01 TaxID=1441053 RepID=UPI001C7D40FF|nr:alpha-ketoglutarate-dependent dioxygenase AlkB [Flavobacterium sp. UMI-01]
MDLFNPDVNPQNNLLPKDGTVNYYGFLFTQQEATQYLQLLLNEIDWKHDEAFIMGKLIVTKRKVAWYGDSCFEYTYSNRTKRATLWSPLLQVLKKRVEEVTGQTFNSCLLNLYHSGEEGMGWHSDAEKDLKKNGAIASLSFGATRKFVFKHKVTKETVTILLESGSLLVMKDETQTYWLHSLPVSKKVILPRINLTFRMIEKL